MKVQETLNSQQQKKKKGGGGIKKDKQLNRRDLREGEKTLNIYGYLISN